MNIHFSISSTYFHEIVEWCWNKISAHNFPRTNGFPFDSICAGFFLRWWGNKCCIDLNVQSIFFCDRLTGWMGKNDARRDRPRRETERSGFLRVGRRWWRPWRRGRTAARAAPASAAPFRRRRRRRRRRPVTTATACRSEGAAPNNWGTSTAPPTGTGAALPCRSSKRGQRRPPAAAVAVVVVAVAVVSSDRRRALP